MQISQTVKNRTINITTTLSTEMLSEEKKKNGPIAVESLFGWVLIGYYDKISTTSNSNATHMLCVNFEICVNI